MKHHKSNGRTLVPSLYVEYIHTYPRECIGGEVRMHSSWGIVMISVSFALELLWLERGQILPSALCETF